MNSFVLKPWRCVAFFKVSLSITFLGTTRSAVFLGARRAAVFLPSVILRVTFFPFGRDRPSAFVLGAARRTAPRETGEGLRLRTGPFFVGFFQFSRAFPSTA